MPIVNVEIYEFDPFGLFPQTTGTQLTYNGPATANGSATINDTQTGIDGESFDDAASETATASTTIGGTSTSGNEVYADEVWTLRDTVTGKEFQLVSFRVNDGANTGWYTLSEIPLVPGRDYETISFDDSPDASGGEAVFSYADYAAASDGEVDGTDGADVIDANYTGDTSNDIVDGNDAPGATNPDVASEFNWSDYTDEQDLRAGVSQDTGEVTVSVSYDDVQTNEEFSAELSGGTNEGVYVAPGETFSGNSAGYILNNGSADDTTITFDFASNDDTQYEDEVQNVAFRISDIDGINDGGNDFRDIVTVTAFDADGNPVTVNITGGSIHTVVDNTITADLTNLAPTSEEASALIEIPGPVSQIIVTYDNGGTTQQAIYFSDIQFDAVGVGVDDDIINAGAGDDIVDAGLGDDVVNAGADNDIVDGGAGDDTLNGDGGNDTLNGGTGSDTLNGGIGDDILDGGANADILNGGVGDDQITMGGGDTATGGDGDDTFTIDTAQLTGAAITITGGEGDETAGDTLDFNGQLVLGSIVYSNTDDNAGGLSGTATLLDGTTVTFSEIETIICFCSGTMIDTPHGPRLVERLRPGDLVLTLDNGPQPIRWVGSRTVKTNENTAPVEFRPGAFGNDAPLLVSPQHRMLQKSHLSELYFGASEVLVPAISLIDGENVLQRPTGLATYHHVMFDTHQIVSSNGIHSESYHPGAHSLPGLEERAREELFSILPELRANPIGYGRSARTSVRRQLGSLLVA